MMVLRLNLGCGNDKRPRTEGWINIDCRPGCHPDLIHDVTRRLPYPDQSVDEILAKDLLEHVPWKQVPQVLKDWLRVLRCGGKIYIQCPNMGALAGKIISNEISTWQDLSYWVYGEQDYPENTHRAGFTIPSLTQLLCETGFKVERCDSDGGSNIMCWAVRP